MDQVDGLQRPNHHLELRDFSRSIPLDHVDAIHGYSVNLDLELQYGIARADDFTDIAKRLVEEHMKGCREVLARDRLAPLRCVDHRRVKDHVLCQQQIKTCNVAISDELMPDSERIDVHANVPAIATLIAM